MGFFYFFVFIISFVVATAIKNEKKEENRRYDRIDSMRRVGIIDCPMCGKRVSSEAKQCPECAHPINTTVRCPKCGSSNVEIISSANKTASVFLVGVFAASTVVSKYKCRKCHNKFS